MTDNELLTKILSSLHFIQMIVTLCFGLYLGKTIAGATRP